MFETYMKIKARTKEFKEFNVNTFGSEGGSVRLVVNLDKFERPEISRKYKPTNYDGMNETIRQVVYKFFQKELNEIAEAAARQTKLDFSGQLSLKLGKGKPFQPVPVVPHKLVNLIMNYTKIVANVYSYGSDSGYVAVIISFGDMKGETLLSMINALLLLEENMPTFKKAVNKAAQYVYSKAVDATMKKAPPPGYKRTTAGGIYPGDKTIDKVGFNWGDRLRDAERRNYLRESKKQPIKIKIGRKR